MPVRGTYNIAGRYCEPEVDIPSRRSALQLLAHPATYDRNYVRSPPRPDTYTFYGFASAARTFANFSSGLAAATQDSDMMVIDTAGSRMPQSKGFLHLPSTAWVMATLPSLMELLSSKCQPKLRLCMKSSSLLVLAQRAAAHPSPVPLTRLFILVAAWDL